MDTVLDAVLSHVPCTGLILAIDKVDELWVLVQSTYRLNHFAVDDGVAIVVGMPVASFIKDVIEWEVGFLRVPSCPTVPGHEQSRRECVVP